MVKLIKGYYGNEALIEKISTDKFCINFYGDFGQELTEDCKNEIFQAIEYGKINDFKMLVSYLLKNQIIDNFSSIKGLSFNGYLILTAWEKF